MTVRVRYDDYSVENDVRWAAGDIILTEKVELAPNKTIRINHSKTPNAVHRFSEKEEFDKTERGSDKKQRR